MSRWRAILVAGALFGALAACSDDESSSETTAAPDTTAAASSTVAPDTTPDSVEDTVADTVAPDTTEAMPTALEWDTVVAPDDCMCGDGSPFNFFVHEASPTKVLFFFEGGGACFSADTCNPESQTYKRSSGTAADLAGRSTGIFDISNPANPFADYSIVYVPYCTGDVHIGNATTDYGDGVVVEHKGFVNGNAALATLVERFPDATEIVVAGESAGSVPSPLYAGLTADEYPEARITVLADGSGAYPDVPGINAVIGGAWGTTNAVPDWPVNEGVTAETWSFPGLFVKAGTHADNITFARHDYAFDRTQVFFAGLAGIPADDLVSLIDQNEAQVEAGGVTLFSYITPGDNHTVLGGNAFYTETVNGVLFVDWVTALVEGEPVEDVHCTVCTV